MAAPLGFKTFATGDVLSAADTNGYLMQGVWTFASAAARTTAVTSPQQGNVSYLKDTNSLEIYSGSAWVAYGSGDITAVTTTAPLQGGASSGAVALTVDAASTTAAGVVQLSDSTSTTSSVLAATPTAVKSAYDLANGAIAKTTVTTAGDIIYRNATVPTRLGIGTTGQVLTVSGGVPSWATPAGGGGKVLQVLQSSFTTATTIATTTFTDTGISSTITPSSNTSKVLVMINGTFRATRNDRQFHIDRRIDRSGTVVFTQGYDSYGFVFPGSGAMEANQQVWTIYLDSPASTSSLTYKLQANLDQTTASLTSTWQNNSYPSVMILMEIGA